MTGTKTLLAHLNLLADGKPTNAAVLLFGSEPQRFHPAAETKRSHCHRTDYTRPFLSYQIYRGDLFDQTDQALDFVQSRGRVERRSPLAPSTSCLSTP